MTINAIRDATNTQEVFSLLAVYVDHAAARGRSHLFPHGQPVLLSGNSQAVRAQLE